MADRLHSTPRWRERDSALFRAQLAPNQPRRILLVEGAPEDARETTRALLRDLARDSLAAGAAVWIGHGIDRLGGWADGRANCRQGGRAVGRQRGNATSPLTQAVQLLGSEHELIVYDLFAGLEPDTLAAAGGALRGGGLLILLCPPLDQWANFVDPAAERIATHPHRAEDVGRRFLFRMARQLNDHAGTLRVSASAARSAANAGRDASGPNIPKARVSGEGITQGDTAHDNTADSRIGASHNFQCGAKPGIGAGIGPWPDAPTNASARARWRLTDEQQQVVAAILELMGDATPRPLVVSAGRGRGKSTALGLAAGALCAQADGPILITAPRFRAARNLLEHARARAGSVAESALEFRSPDCIVRERPAAALLLVDEAAGIPTPLLRQLLNCYPRSIFATTAQGYEGTGRGFALRFFPLLDQSYPGWRHLALSQPVRFPAGDPLEALIDRLLLLDADPATAEEIQATALQPVRVERIDRDRLIDDEAELRQLFGLLTLAHYQTRPSDLRHLLDGPNLHLTALRRGDVLLGTALCAREGGLDEALRAAIFAGERRPRGHLLPQTLSAHAGLAEAPSLCYSRIVRIAIHPAAQRRGFGRRLLAHLVEEATAEGLDLIGASFGATTELMSFWHAGGFSPVQLGSHPNAASGARAAVVLRALSPSGEQLLSQARFQFTDRLLHLLPGRLRTLEPALVGALLAENQRPSSLEVAGPAPTRSYDNETLTCEPLERRLSPSLRSELSAFAHQQRTLEAALPVLARLAPQPLGAAIANAQLSPQRIEAFIATVLQQHPPEAVAASHGHPGRDSVIRQLRETVAMLLP